MKKIYSILLALSILIFCSTAGCTPAKKPTPTVPPAKTTPTTPARKPATTMTAEQKMANRVATDVKKVSGVKKATVVVSGRTAYIGLTLEPSVEKTKTTTIKNDVSRRAKAIEPGLATVHVTSEPDLVTRLDKIAASIKEGKPVSGFTSELTEIGRRIAPKTK